MTAAADSAAEAASARAVASAGTATSPATRRLPGLDGDDLGRGVLDPLARQAAVTEGGDDRGVRGAQVERHQQDVGPGGEGRAPRRPRCRTPTVIAPMSWASVTARPSNPASVRSDA